MHVLRVLSAREENEMANIAKNIERQAFSLVIDNVLKSMRKDREAALLKIVDLAQKFMGNNFSPRLCHFIRNESSRTVVFIGISGRFA